MRGERGKRSFRLMSHLIATLFYITIVTLCIITISCGLPTTEYLYPPAIFSSTGGVLVIEHDKRNIDEPDVYSIFQGYEIYYRVFDNSDNATNSYSYISNMKSTNVINTANYYKYYPLKHGKDVSPLIKVSDNTYTYYYLKMLLGETWTLIGDDPASTTILDSVVRNTSEDFYLYSKYEVGDLDYDGSNSSPSKVYIVFFAFAYGFDLSTMENVYSDPVIFEPVEYSPGGT